MNQEDIQKALETISKSGINVAGDLVLEKKVEYEVNNVEAGGVGIQINNSKETPNQQKLFPQLPSQEEMKQAVRETMSQGLWWSSRSWAVVYRVYQMKGYMNGFTQFAREAKEWGIDTDFECNYDAIQKPISSGIYSGMPDQWEAQGAQKQAVKLAKVLLEILENTKIEKKIS